MKLITQIPTRKILPLAIASLAVAGTLPASAATTAYRNLILGDSPIVYYELDETSGTNASNSGSAGATLDMDEFKGGAISLGQTSAAAFLGTSYDFGGGYIEANTAIPNSLPEWTFEAWIKTSKTGSSTILSNDQGGWNDDVLIGVGADGSNGGTGGNFGISQQGNPGTTRDTPSAAISTTAWQHVAITGSEANAEILVYINGVQLGSDTSLVNGATFNGADGFGSVAFLTIGQFRDNNGSQLYDGLLDEVALYGSVLTPTDLLARVNFVPVPEPSSTALLGLGGLALIFRRRK